jgi:hypothetical protein
MENTLNDIGAVLSFDLPAGWIEAPPRPTVGGRQLRVFHPQDKPAVRFCTYLRAVALSDPASRAFEQVLYDEFHKLRQEEIDTLADVFEGVSNSQAFQLIEAGTGYLNTRRVIRVYGRWIKAAEETMLLFIDVRGDARIVQQIYFTAPTADFKEFSAIADDIFVSIKWRPT